MTLICDGIFRNDQDEKKRSGSSVSFDKEAMAKNPRGSVRLQSGKCAIVFSVISESQIMTNVTT